MTLRELIVAHPMRFYPQSWYAAERFLDTPIPDDARRVPPSRAGKVARLSALETKCLPLAATLARAYLIDPRHPIWTRYLWCADVDAQGQRIYVGTNGHGFEIHRHIKLTERFGAPSWS